MAFTVRGPHFEYHCLVIILESRCHHSSSLRMRKLRHSVVKEHAQPHSIAESTLRLRDPRRTLCHPACIHSLGSLYPIPARMDGQADEKSGHHSWALPSGLTTASQDVPSLYRQGREGSTNQGPGKWVAYPRSHSSSGLGTCCQPPHSLTSTPPPHTVNRNCIPHIQTPTRSSPS